MTGLRPYKNKRDASEPAIIAALESAGALVERMDKPCDLLVRVAGRTFLCEVKTPKGKLTDDQQAFIARGWEVWILRDPMDAVNMINCLRRVA